jgi:molecular chaperone HtpG
MNMQRMLRAAGHAMPQSQPALEVNPDHPLVKRLQDASEDAGFADWASLLFEQALLREGGQLPDPASFVRRMNSLLVGQQGMSPTNDG